MLSRVVPRVPHPPVEPPRSVVRFPDPRRGSRENAGAVAVGCDFSPGTLLAAYRRGIFPWPEGSVSDDDGEPLVVWCSPDPRCIYPLGETVHRPRRFDRTLRRHPFTVTVDEDFAGVVRMCGQTRRGDTWIIPEVEHGYGELHRLGWAHSIEVWETRVGGRSLVGGIYGVAVGGLFAGESMFHTRRDASKIAFAFLVDRLRALGYGLFDVQVANPHLVRQGCVEIPRREYLTRLATALETPPPAWS